MEHNTELDLPIKKGIKYAMPNMESSEDDEESQRSLKRNIPNPEEMAIFDNFENSRFKGISKQSPIYIYKQIVENLKSKNIPGVVNFRKMEETKIQNFLAK